MRDAPNTEGEVMEIAAEVPAWLTWLTAGGIGMFIVAALARTLEAVFDLDPS
jgi:hypothetical protein